MRYDFAIVRGYATQSRTVNGATRSATKFAGPVARFLLETESEVIVMNIIDPDRLRLHPGQGMKGIFTPSGSGGGEIGFFIRSQSGGIRQNGSVAIEQRAGLIQFNEVMLVLTMLKVGQAESELFDIWWNFYSSDEQFRRMSTQESLSFHFYDETGWTFTTDRENRFKKFFTSLPSLLEKAGRWSESQFDRAVRGFCSQSYPKENLWDLILHGPHPEELDITAPPGLETYPGHVPDELRPYYTYHEELGHCIRVAPSMLEQDVLAGNGEENLLPAPVKTVLRGGVRWVNGYPVAPIPFIPGYGLAVPPEDQEM